MAELNFPANPLDGDRFESYVYDGPNDVWNFIPNSINDLSDVYINGEPDDMATLVYNQNSNMWVPDATDVIPVGSITPYTSATSLDGYLFCDGSIVLRSQYPKLFEAIGTKYNTSGETSLQFRLPNISGRAVVGLDSSQTEFDSLGKVGGSPSHTLSVAEMPAHTHIQDSHTHTQNAHSHTQDAHSHGISIWWNPNDWENGSFGLGYFGSWGNVMAVTGGWGMGTDSRQPYIYGTTATNNANTATNQNTGGNQSHNNLQPYTVLKYVIKY